MEKTTVFEACLSRRDVGLNGTYAELTLPATYYELQDALDKARLEDGADVCIEITNYSRFPFLEPFLEDENNIYELNALAAKLAALEPWKADALEGLVIMEGQKDELISLPCLYDLAASAGECQVLYNVRSDAELGGFYALNGFLPELEGLSDAVYELLDEEKIGSKMRQDDGGVFLHYGSGYVTLVGNMKEEFKTLDMTPRKPDYTVLLEVGVPDTDDSVMLGLPCEREALNDVLTRLKAGGWSVLTWRCADCRIPALCDAFSMTDNILFANSAARQLSELSGDALLEYRALAEVFKINDLNTAVEFMERMDDYAFSPEYDAPETVARKELEYSMGKSEAQLAMPFVDLRGYGQKLMKEQNQAMTSYGVLCRRDGQPIQTMTERDQTTTCEMEMRQM